MARDFEDHCWKDMIDPDTMQIYQAYRRKTYVGDNPAVLAIDLYNKAYLGGDRPVKEVDRRVLRLVRGKCLEGAGTDPEAVRKRAPRRHSGDLYDAPRDTGGVQSTNRNLGRQGEDIYDIKAELAPQPGELVIYKERASGFFGTPLIAHLQQLRINSLIICGESTSGCVRASHRRCLFLRLPQRAGRGMHLRPLDDQPQGQSVRSASQICRRHAYRGGAGPSRRNGPEPQGGLRRRTAVTACAVTSYDRTL